MRALHISPVFNPGAGNGSDRHFEMLSNQLQDLGVSVEFWSTRTGAINQQSAFGIRWPEQLPARTRHGSLQVTRFATFEGIPRRAGYVVTAAIAARWRKEERSSRSVEAPNRIDSFIRRAYTRSKLYDALALVGRGPWSMSLLRAFVSNASSFDVVLVGYCPFGTLTQIVFLARKLQVPVVVAPLFHPDELSHHFRSHYWAISRADAILAMTPYSAKLFKQRMPPARPIVVGSGVNTLEFQSPSISGERFRQRFGLQDFRIVLLVGRKEPEKRWQMAVEALEFLGGDVRLVMIGEDIDRCPIGSNKVSFLGRLSRADLIDAYDAADVVVFPSERESFGLVIPEAWMRKKPVIANRNCELIQTLVSDGESGLLAGDARELSLSINQLIAEPSMARRMGEVGYATAMKHYTWDAVGRKVLDVYHQVTTGR